LSDLEAAIQQALFSPYLRVVAHLKTAAAALTYKTDGSIGCFLLPIEVLNLGFRFGSGPDSW